jgi:hypothetical protein
MVCEFGLKAQRVLCRQNTALVEKKLHSSVDGSLTSLSLQFAGEKI